MRFKILLILLILLLIPFTLATQYNSYNIEELKTLYNNNLNKVPGIVRALIGNEAINLHYTSLEGQTATVGIRTHSARIISVKETIHDEPTMNVYVSEDTVNAIREGKITLQHAIRSERIRYESLRFKTRLKTGLLKATIKVWGWFT